ncbi:hypothetical protein GGF46_004087 [Coemansia sp. RSA 552]|nr:hypothetical protein GGF46_004087 [Coemansia sp. RSA 552]
MSTISSTRDSPSDDAIERAGMELGHAPAGLLRSGVDEHTRQEATRLCARDYLEHHVFFNEMGHHNHFNHHLLSIFTMGASSQRLQEVFDLHKTIQLPLLAHYGGDQITSTNLFQHATDEKYYSRFVEYFRRELDSAGSGWKEYACNLSMAPQMLPLTMSGVFHPLIQLGYGLEFESKAITAMGLAQACAHAPFFETMFSPGVFGTICGKTQDNEHCGASLMQIVRMIRDDPIALGMEYDPQPHLNHSIVGAAEKLAIMYTALWAVPPTKEAISAKYCELQSFVALFYGGLTRPGHKPVLQFIGMHCLTSAYFLPIYFDCMPIETQAVLLKAHYVFEKAIVSDDLHVSKVVRSLWRGSMLTSPPQAKLAADYELPPQINWLYLAHMTTDTITASFFEDIAVQAKAGKQYWVYGMVGRDEFWSACLKE